MTPRPTASLPGIVTRTRADGSVAYRVMFRINGKQTSETFDDLGTARRFQTLGQSIGWAAAREIRDARSAPANAGQLTLADWCQEHVAHLVGVTDGTRRRYHAYIRNDLGALGLLPLAAVTEQTVGTWVRDLLAAGASGKTIKNKHGFLSAALETAVRAGHIPANPSRGTKLPKTEREEMTFLTSTEFAILLGYVTPYWQPLVSTLVATGLRWSEATALQVRDVDLAAASLRVSRAWKETSGEGRKLGPPKSGRSRRTIALAPETVELLTPLVAGKKPTDWVFTNQHGGPVRGQTFHENVWAPAVRLANGEPAGAGKRVARRRNAAGTVIQPATTPLGKHPRIHDLRHTCASWLLASGLPLNVVQYHLGHESITTTSDRYGHALPTARSAVALAMSHALTQAHPQIEG